MKNLKSAFFIILFVWISFFPQPIQDRYWIYVRIFFGIFILILILNKKYLRFLFSFKDLPLWLFLICLLAGTVSATDKSVALRTYLYLVTTFLPLFYIGKYLYGSDKNINIVNRVICICAALVALIGLMELYFGRNVLYEKFIANPFYERYVRFNPRPMSTQFNPAVLGSYLLGCLPFSFYFFMAQESIKHFPIPLRKSLKVIAEGDFLENKLLYLRLLGIFASLLCVSVIFLTFSRGVFLGLIALLSFYLWSRHKRKIIIFLFSLVLVVCVSSFQKGMNFNRFGFKRFILGSYDSMISEYRISRINMTMKILKDYPLFGIGFNHFRLRFNEYCDKKDIGELYEFMIPDNMYLTFLAETGIIGMLGFLLFIFLLLKGGLKQFNRLKDASNKQQILLIPLSALIGLLVNMGAYELFYWNNPYMLFCLICGFIQGAVEKSDKVTI